MIALRLNGMMHNREEAWLRVRKLNGRSIQAETPNWDSPQIKNLHSRLDHLMDLRKHGTVYALGPTWIWKDRTPWSY
ncbi:hypothetical protein M404DRAFT_991265 [Pisolithus tinctorius Marx 270]|uniref:Uncharacterized protein n=1 Tax=Pisolithus tinctorius Marx 270 TaxID=870435 RepID=A0A0C3PYY9_PISTI|nr:hypothetical protein M404DRAFT_991265 [Pisolithus tinctorius Marx 270]